MRKLTDGLWLLDDYRLLDTKNQKVSQPLEWMKGQGIAFNGKPYRFFASVHKFLEEEEGTMGIFPAYIADIEKKGKTTYATIADNMLHKFICDGKRPIDGSWTDIKVGVTEKTPYFIYAKKCEQVTGEIIPITAKLLQHGR